MSPHTHQIIQLKCISVLRTIGELDIVKNNSLLVRENSPIELFSSASDPTENVLNSVEVYEHEKYNKNQTTGGNESYKNAVAVYLHFPTSC